MLTYKHVSISNQSVGQPVQFYDVFLVFFLLHLFDEKYSKANIVKYYYIFLIHFLFEYVLKSNLLV